MPLPSSPSFRLPHALIAGLILGAAPMAVADAASTGTAKAADAATTAAGDADCTALWREADRDSNGAISTGEDADRYIEAFARAGIKTLAPDTISRDEFLKACKGGLFNRGLIAGPARGTPPKAPGSAAKDYGKGDITPGLVPLTEEAARSRLRANGFADVTDLALDDKGIWHGTAIANGKRVRVAVDPQGDIIGSD